MNANNINQKLSKLNYFVGTFPCDRIPIVIKRPAYFVINTDSHDKPGEHWVCMILKPNETGEYFDSFGLPPLVEHIKYYLDYTCPKGWCYNTVTLQGLTSFCCGQYCIIYLILRSKNYKKGEIISLFNKNCEINDKIVTELFKVV